MTNKEKQELADWLFDNNSETAARKLDEVKKYKHFPVLVTPTGKLSKAKLDKFMQKWCTVKTPKPIENKVADLLYSNTSNHYILVIDESGSTGYITKEITNGVNTFVNNLAKQDSNAEITLIPFEGSNVIVKPTILAKRFNNYEHYAKGGTPLNEAIIKAIEVSKNQINSTIVVFTDGDDTDPGMRKDTKNKFSTYKGTMVFIGTGKSYAQMLNIKEGNILTFEANQKGTEIAYNTLIEASIEHTKGIKEGKDMSKEDFFKTKTELATMLKKSANLDITVCYEKKMTPEQMKENIAKAKKYMTNFISASALKDKDYVELFDIMNTVEERILVGKHDGSMDEFGRYKFLEFNSKTPKNPYRLVNPDTILWMELKGIRYNKK